MAELRVLSLPFVEYVAVAWAEGAAWLEALGVCVESVQRVVAVLAFFLKNNNLQIINLKSITLKKYALRNIKM